MGRKKFYMKHAGACPLIGQNGTQKAGNYEELTTLGLLALQLF
jgi:hypothetical protein